jgi:phospholipid/cholesterol/gamma-HCH transport system substrate-binding protein
MVKKERGIEVKVGLLIFVALGLLAAFVIVLGNFSLSKGFAFAVDFDFSGNLQAGAPVKVAGIKLGKVQRVDYLAGRKDPKTGRRVYVRAHVWVEERVRGTVFEDAEFFINTQGVLGEQYLEIVPGTPGKRAVVPGDVLVGVTPPRMDLVVARLYEVLDGVTRLLREDKQSISNLLRAGTRAVKTVDVLLSENRGEIKRLLASLDKFTAEAGELIKNVRAGVGHPQRLRNLLASVEKTSTSISRNIDGLLARTNRALDGVSRVTAAVGPDERKKIKRALDQLVKLGDRVYAVTGDAQKMLARLNRGKGTAGAFLVKDELYDDLKEMVRDLKRNPWKFLWRE